MKLAASDLLTLRQKWVDDYVNTHPEVGNTATVKTTAAAGSLSLALQALGTGTITKGTVLRLNVGGRSDSYTVTADSDIVTNEATVSVSPALAASVPSTTAVAADPYYQSIYNRAERKEFFSDSELDDLAGRAESMYGKRISAAKDPAEWLFRAIRKLANEAKLDATEYLAAVRAMSRDRYDLEIDKLVRSINGDRAAVESQAIGPVSFPVWR